MAQNHVKKHVDLIAQHEEKFLAQRSFSERLGDSIASFAGSFPFVIVHLLVFLGWIVANAASIAHVPHFDPPPYSLLATLVALEAIVLASFILMRQTRMSRRADEREHLMLQILLLVEKEVTAVIGMNRHIATDMGLDKVANSSEVRELNLQTSIEDIAQTIKEALPSSE